MKNILVTLGAAACVFTAGATQTVSGDAAPAPVSSEQPAAVAAAQEAAEPVAIAEKPAYLNLSTVFRFDYHVAKYDGQNGVSNPNTGFMGDRLQVNMKGEVADGLTYSWRQNLNRLNEDGKFFNSTDWLYLNYEHKGWNFQAGKVINAIGGYEYDRNPADLFCNSVFWYNIAPFNFGASVGYRFGESDLLTLQITEAMEFTPADRNMYSYNAMWTGNHGCWKSLWSVNLNQIAPDRYISYIALGNRFELGNFDVELDLMNRAGKHQAYFLKDYSVMAEAGWKPAEGWRFFGKFTCDKNNSGTDYDHSVLNGTDLKMAGGGVEYIPFKNNRSSVRFHAAGFYSWGNNANTGNLMQNKTFFASAGLTWRMNFLNLK